MDLPIAVTSPHSVHLRHQEGQASHLVDVRSPAEYDDGHAEGSVSIPTDELSAARLNARLGTEAGSTEPVYLICASGRRAEQAAHNLRGEGLNNLVLVKGGTEAWSREQLPMRRVSKVWSLERQTQIALGVLILAMLAKGTLLHPVFLGLVGLLGIGLIVSGVTARCGLSGLLARMPWNRKPDRGAMCSV